jgi:ElaB/YqjD/DUF883 family membrane-anchored ribosome-binding protein
MENIKNSSSEWARRPGIESTVPSSGTISDTAGDVANAAASAVQRAGEGVKSAYEDTRQAVNDAYEKTSDTLNNTYDQAMSYGKENPGKLTLIAFGAGIGIGVLLASNVSRGRSRSSRVAEPIVAALSQVAMEFLR